MGDSVSEAFKVWASLIDVCELSTMSTVFDRYLQDVVPNKAKATQSSDIRAIGMLRPVFGSMPPCYIKPKHIYKYRDYRSQNASTVASRELAVLSHVFTKAIEWGVLEIHPMTDKKVVKHSKKDRDRYIQDWELEEFLGHCSPLLFWYIQLKLLTGARKGAIALIRVDDIRSDGLYVTENKVNKKRVYSWNDELIDIIRQILNLHEVKSEWLFCTKEGGCLYRDGVSPALSSAWRRAMKKAKDAGVLKESFTEHDIRAKAASDATEDHALKLTGHTTRNTLRKIYRRKAEVIEPRRLKI
ncbi:MAG: tyrosine-type recombinase/integrase [Pseudomonadota bacterium]